MRNVTFSRELEAPREQRQRLFGSVPRAENECLRVEGFGEHVREPHRLRRAKGHLQPVPRVIEPTQEEKDPAHLRGERREISIVLVVAERTKGLLHPGGSLVRPAQEPECLAHPCREARGVVMQSLFGEQRVRTLESG